MEVIDKIIEFELVEKLDNVTGNKSNADAKIAGITPAVLTFKGK